MIKKLLSLALMLTLCIGINAQDIFQFGGSFNNTRKALASKAPSRVSGSYSFTYYPDDLSQAEPYGFGLGDNSKAGSEYNVAIFVPASLAGKTISTIKFAIDDEIVTDIKAWTNSSLPSTWSAAENFADNITLGKQDYVTTATFSTPVTIPAAGCYVGYSFKMPAVSTSEAKYPVAVAKLSSVQAGSLYLTCKSPDVAWSDLSGSSYKYAAAISVTINDNDLKANSAEFTSNNIGTVYGEKGKTYTFKANMKNLGANALESVSYTVKDLTTNEVSEEKTATVAEPIATLTSGDVTFEATADGDVSTFNKELTITKINGSANEATENLSTSFTLATLAKTYTRKIVEEEATATGCGPCARGYAGMKALEEKYPDTWIGIAAHITGINYNDPMYCSTYTSATNRATGVPAAWLNRINEVDPYFGTNDQMLGIVDDMEAELAKPAIAGVTAKASWDDAMNIISVSTDVEFGINSATDKFGLAYVLLANGLKAPENSKYPSRWYQNDAYYGMTANEPYIAEWCNKKNVKSTTYGTLVTDMVYDHVAIQAKNISKGTTGSIANPIVAGEVQNHTTTFNVTNGIKNSAGDDLIQDKTKLEVVALLINQATGEIVNADKVSITGGDPSGISTVGTNGKAAKEVARYTVDGRQVSAPVKGPNIVKMSDGTTVKVMVK